MKYLLFGLVIIIMMGAAETECETPPPPACPTVGEESRIGHHLRWSTRSAIQDLLADPSSYEYRDMTLFSEFTVERADGSSSYHNFVTVDFTANNAFGGRVAGTADVVLIETEEDGCVAIYAELTE